jgi:NAD(P)-dependent dehydrogenase (short-subunit alcohol dehydrogenase family)
MSLVLIGRTAVITGAASGIGKALACEAAARGMSLALADSNTEALSALVEALSAKTSVISKEIDVRSRDALNDFAQQVAGTGASIALVFANAGVMRAGTSWKLAAEDWDLVFDVNVKGVMHTASAFMPVLQSQNAESRIVITGSTSAFLPRSHLAAYSSSKHALWGIAEAMQIELAEEKSAVAVSFLAPSGVKTSIASSPLTGPTADQQKTISELLEAFGMPAEEVATIAFDALEKESFWIFPQPEFKAALTARAQAVCEERDPGFQM